MTEPMKPATERRLRKAGRLKRCNVCRLTEVQFDGSEHVGCKGKRENTSTGRGAARARREGRPW